MSIVEARAPGQSAPPWSRGRLNRTRLPRRAVQPFLARGATRRAQGLLAEVDSLFEVTAALAHAKVGPVSVVRPDFGF